MSETRCFFYGLGIGAAAALLMAPRSGVKTRRKLANTALEGQEAILREGAELRDTVIDALDRTKRAGAELRDTVVDTMDRTKRAAKTAADGVGAAFEAGRAQLVR